MPENDTTTTRKVPTHRSLTLIGLPANEPFKCNNRNKELHIGQRPHKQQRHLFHLGKKRNC